MESTVSACENCLPPAQTGHTCRERKCFYAQAVCLPVLRALRVHHRFQPVLDGAAKAAAVPEPCRVGDRPHLSPEPCRADNAPDGYCPLLPAGHRRAGGSIHLPCRRHSGHIDPHDRHLHQSFTGKRCFAHQTRPCGEQPPGAGSAAGGSGRANTGKDRYTVCSGLCYR